MSNAGHRAMSQFGPKTDIDPALKLGCFFLELDLGEILSRSLIQGSPASLRFANRHLVSSGSAGSIKWR
jgi:hypothetical protein